jgi:hypothetical protein
MPPNARLEKTRKIAHDMTICAGESGTIIAPIITSVGNSTFHNNCTGIGVASIGGVASTSVE